LKPDGTVNFKRKPIYTLQYYIDNINLEMRLALRYIEMEKS